MNPDIDFVNNARSATKSYINSLCLSRFLNATADLVFVEFVANDGERCAFCEEGRVQQLPVPQPLPQRDC